MIADLDRAGEKLDVEWTAQDDPRTEGSANRLRVHRRAQLWLANRMDDGNLATWKKRTVLALLVLLSLWHQGLFSRPQSSKYARQPPSMPSYVLDYAPLVWLDSEEEFYPSDISAQIRNTSPLLDYSPLPSPPRAPLNLSNLDLLNEYGLNGSNIYLTSKVDVTTKPTYLLGVRPNSYGLTPHATSSCIIINDHGDGTVDVFYMYFYAYNLGNTVLWNELGDHIGDWEHNMVRFVNELPTAVWYSQHANGEAFTYAAVEKLGIRPVVYSARGSHANYAVSGLHDHTIPDLNLPAGLILDYTSKGLLWDPTLSAYFYHYDATAQNFTAADSTSPVGFMDFKGQWGDEQYPDDDERQKSFLSFRKFVGGPTGPWDKALERKNVCPSNGILCIVRTIRTANERGPRDP